MKRYTTVSGLFWTDEGYGATADTVIVEERLSKDTGLVDSSGTRIYRHETRQPVGFVELRERNDSP